VADSSLRDSVLEAVLRQSPNPFADSTVRGAHDSVAVDVPDLHAEPYRRIRELIERVRLEARPRIQVVLGDPGDGKTHMLWRLRKLSEDSWRTDAPIALASIAPLREPGRPFAHIYREAAASLSNPLPYIDPFGEQPASQLERLGWLVLAGAVAHLAAREGRFPDWGAERVPRFLASFVQRAMSDWDQAGPIILERARSWAELQRIEPDVWRVLGRIPSEPTRAAALSWLRGAVLDDRDLARWGFPPSVDGEDRAFRVLTSLCNCPGTPVVLGFDQIEGVRRLGVEAPRQLFAALVELFHQRARLVCIVLCQTSVWPEIRDKLEQQIRDRLEPPIRLRGISAAEALALCSARMAPVWKDSGHEPPFATWPVPASEITGVVDSQSCRTPRQVIRWMAERLGADGPAVSALPEPPAPPESVFDLHVVRERAAVFDRTPESRASIARTAVHLAMDALAASGLDAQGVVVREVKTRSLRTEGEGATVAVLEYGSQKHKVHIEATNASHGGSVKALAQRLARAVASKQATRALLLREQNSPLPAAAATLIDSVEQVGVAWLMAEEVALLAAFESFAHATQGEESPEEAIRSCARQAAGLQLIARILRAPFETAAIPPPSADPDLVHRIEEVLASRRTVIREVRLADMLGVPRQEVARALDHLYERGVIGLTSDAGMARVVYRRS